MHGVLALQKMAGCPIRLQPSQLLFGTALSEMLGMLRRASPCSPNHVLMWMCQVPANIKDVIPI